MKAGLAKWLMYYPVTYLHGERVAKYYKKSLDFQYRSRAQIEAYQLQSLNRLLKHAYKNVPFYKQKLDEAGIRGGVTSLSEMAKLPTITKSDLAGGQLMAGEKKFFWSKKTTGGSTGQAVTLFKNPEALAKERAVTWRGYKWAGINIADPQARFWGVPINVKSRLKYRLIDLASNRVRFSAFNFTDENLEQYYKDVSAFKPRYLYGYVSLIEEFAAYLGKKQYSLPKSVGAIITTSEVLTEAVKVKIEKYLNVPVFNEYGCGEVGSIAHQCENKSLHLMEDNLIIEVDGDNEGELIVTDLHNFATPLIRYRLGDYGVLCASACGCGRTLKILSSIKGRAYDTLITPDGRRFHPEFVMYMFEALKEKGVGIDAFQVVQKSISDVEVALVLKDRGEKAGVEGAIKNFFFKNLSSQMILSFRYVDEIEREVSGKLRLVKSELN